MAKRATRSRKTHPVVREPENIGPAPKVEAAESPETEAQATFVDIHARRGLHPQAMDRILHPQADPEQIHPGATDDPA